MSDKKKKKKEKVIYYDDNSTISDMSGVKGGISFRSAKKEEEKEKENHSFIDQPKPPSTAREKFRTYFAAVKMMILPMLVVLAVLGLLYVILMLLSGGFN